MATALNRCMHCSYVALFGPLELKNQVIDS